MEEGRPHGRVGIEGGREGEREVRRQEERRLALKEGRWEAER